MYLNEHLVGVVERVREEGGEADRGGGGQNECEGLKWAAEKWHNCGDVYRTIAKKMKQMAILLFLVFSDSIDFNGWYAQRLVKKIVQFSL